MSKPYPRVYRMVPLADLSYLRIYEYPGQLVGSVDSFGRVSRLMKIEKEMVWPWIDVTDDPEVQAALRATQHLVAGVDIEMIGQGN